MAMFQPFKSATQRKGSAVNDLMVQQQIDAARREMMHQNMAGAAQLGKWGLGKDTSPWADALYGTEAAVTPEATSAALRAGEGIGGNVGASMGSVAPAAGVDAGLNAGINAGLTEAAAVPVAEALAVPAAEAAIGASAVPAATTGAAAAGGASPLLAAAGPVGMGIGGLLLARQLGLFG